MPLWYSKNKQHENGPKFNLNMSHNFRGLLWWPSGKECSAEDASSFPGLGRSFGRGNGNPPQYSCLNNPMNRKSQLATVHRVAKSWTQLSHWAHTHTYNFRKNLNPKIKNWLILQVKVQRNSCLKSLIQKMCIIIGIVKKGNEQWVLFSKNCKNGIFVNMAASAGL